MLNVNASLRRIVKFASVGTFCLATLSGNPAYCSSPEEFGDERSRFIQSAIHARQKIIEIAYENIAQLGSCGYRTQRYNLASTHDDEGHRVMECKTWTLNNILGGLKEGTSDLDLAFDSAKGFFVVTNTPETPLKGLAYTRAGDFMYDRNGYVLNSAGYYLMGWKLDEDESIPTGTVTSSVSSLELINATSSSGTFRPTNELDVQVNLPADAVMGDTHPVNTRVIDSLGIGHEVLLTYTKTATALEWDLTLWSADAVVDGILQTSGANAGVAYTNMTLQFDGCGRLDSYNGVPAEVTPPTASINWASTAAANSALTLNFGAAGASDAMRIMGDRALTVKNDDDGRGFSTHAGNYVSREGGFYDILSNSDKVKTHTIAVANFNAANFLKRSTYNVFYETEESGNYVLGRALGSGFAGTVSGMLEDSTVDRLSEEENITQAQNEIQA